MRVFLLRLVERLRYSYWFVPTLMVVGATVLAFAMGVLDDQLLDEQYVEELSWIYTGGPEGARSILETVAASMITVAGVVFSITIVALTLASSQFGPRLLRNFMRDTGNQVTLGTFLATFVYCLLVVRTVRSLEDSQYVPHASVTMALAMALLSLVVLIYFIHHAASSIQAPHVIHSVAQDLTGAIETLFPEEIGDDTGDVDEPAPPPESLSGAAPVLARSCGYVQALDEGALMTIAAEGDVAIEVLRRPGTFVADNHAIARVAPAKCAEDLASKIRGAFVVASQRSVEQDVGFAFEQLVSVCVRALSPGINDPFTAMLCIERLAAGLGQLARRKIPSAWRLDDGGRKRVLAPPLTFSEVLTSTYDMIRPYAVPNPEVTLRMLDMLTLVAHDVRRHADRRVIAEQATVLQRHGQDAAAQMHDRERIRERYDRVMDVINEAARGPSGRARPLPLRSRPTGS